MVAIRRHPPSWSLAFAAVCASACGAVLFGATPLAVGAPPKCGVDLAAPQIARAAAALPPYPGLGAPWSADPPSVEGNFDRCATLSTAIVTVDGATGSSPMMALMFHDGTYLGTATSKAYPFTSLNAARTTDDTVVLDYKDGRHACTACPGPINSVRYQWQRDHVAMLDPAPPG